MESGTLTVIGVGRVGSYSKAKAGGYSRSRKYWAIARWSNNCSKQCREMQKRRGDHKIHYPLGWVEDKSRPTFKTKTAAQEYLKGLGHALL